MTVEIVLLAMVALFVAFRLYAVLGQRTGHEQQPVTRPDAVPTPDRKTKSRDVPQQGADAAPATLDNGAAAGVRAIIAADPSFDMNQFLEGAQGAYRMILEAFWKGDREELRYLVGGDVLPAFEGAITEREAAGQTLDNRLVGIEKASIDSAEIVGRTARIEVRFEADVVAITRNAEGEVVAGSLSDAVSTHDIWTFERNLDSRDPNWLLVETDEVA